MFPSAARTPPAMNVTPPSRTNYDALIRSWTQHVPWYRRITARLGLQGKLVICFTILLVVALGVCTWVSVRFCRQRLSEVMVDQAQQLSATLALASQHDMARGRVDALQRLAEAMVRSQNVLLGGFLDPSGRAVAVSSHSAHFGAKELGAIRHDPEHLMRVEAAQTADFGDFLEIVAPVIAMPDETPAQATDGAATGSAGVAAHGESLIGYLVLGISDVREQSQLRQLYALVSGIGCIMLTLGFPLAYLVVRRVFVPIRQLVAATQKIIAGDLNTQVAIHRPDLIGDLARCFNEMVRWVQQQRFALAAANEQLGLANRKLATANTGLAEANRGLEAKVQQRTVELETANGCLRQEIAEKEDFLRAVSHDLNAPLRNISGMAAMLLMKHKAQFDEDVIHRIERIKTNVELETDLISELLELSRIKTRRQKMEAVELVALLDEMGGLFEQDLMSRNIELAIETPLPVLLCERSRMRQIFQNLIDNAIKYMGDGAKKRIAVGCEVRPGEAEFYVSDSGQGIAAEDMDKIFFVFRRGKAAAAQNIPGKGVGLASVKSIIQTYGGRIWAQSKLGQGTIFHFTINGQYVCGAGAVGAAKIAANESQNAQEADSEDQADLDESEDVAPGGGPSGSPEQLVEEPS
jgi:signal transduction histidine kinase